MPCRAIDFHYVTRKYSEPRRLRFKISENTLGQLPRELIKAQIHFSFDFVKQKSAFEHVKGAMRSVIINAEWVENKSACQSLFFEKISNSIISVDSDSNTVSAKIHGSDISIGN